MLCVDTWDHGTLSLRALRVLPALAKQTNEHSLSNFIQWRVSATDNVDFRARVTPFPDIEICSGILGTAYRGYLIPPKVKGYTKESPEWKSSFPDLENHTYVQVSFPQAGNINKCFRFNGNVNVHLFRIMQKHNSVDWLKRYTFKNDLCLAISTFERGVFVILGICCVLHGSLMTTTCGRGELTCPSVPARRPPTTRGPCFPTRKWCTGLWELSFWHCLPELIKCFGLKVRAPPAPPFQSSSSFRMNVLNFKET